jgi:hypothetical protein
MLAATPPTALEPAAAGAVPPTTAKYDTYLPERLLVAGHASRRLDVDQAVKAAERWHQPHIGSGHPRSDTVSARRRATGVSVHPVVAAVAANRSTVARS